MSHTIAELEILALEAAGGPQQGLTPAEIHGVVVGIGVADPERFEIQDLVDLLGTEALADTESVNNFVAATLDSLYVDDMSFKLLLPDDEADMSERLTALAHWCQSFLEGYVVGLKRRGIGEMGGLPEEVKEIVQDMVAIAQLDPEHDEDDPEADFVELEEYVKVGTLLILSFSYDAGIDTEE